MTWKWDERLIAKAGDREERQRGPGLQAGEKKPPSTVGTPWFSILSPSNTGGEDGTLGHSGKVTGV